MIVFLFSNWSHVVTLCVCIGWKVAYSSSTPWTTTMKRVFFLERERERGPQDALARLPFNQSKG